MHLVKIHAPANPVYRALTTPAGVRNWWTGDVALESAVGGTGEFRFNDRRFVIKVAIQELTPDTRVWWRVVSPDLFDGTSVQFELSPNEGHTMLSFTHRGFKWTDDTYAAATTRWGYYLVSLKRYLESGKGAPSPNELDA
jgi:uncharacterized protein YndB with AHSA1/START domain